MADHSEFFRLAGEQFVSLTTFRKSGDAVATAVWISRSDDRLIVTTSGESGKVKRLRNDDRVELRACSRSGVVTEGAPVSTGVATVITDAAEIARLRESLKRKYGAQYTLIMGVQGLARRSKSASVILSIAPARGPAR